MENEYLIDDFKIDTETELFTNGEIKSYPAAYEGNLQILSGTASDVTITGRMKICDDGGFHFYPTVSSSVSRFNTLFTTNHAQVRETKKSLICVIRIPKHWGIKKILSVHYETFLEVHNFIRNFKRR